MVCVYGLDATKYASGLIITIHSRPTAIHPHAEKIKAVHLFGDHWNTNHHPQINFGWRLYYNENISNSILLYRFAKCC